MFFVFWGGLSKVEDPESSFFQFTPPKTNMDTQNDGLEKVTPFKYSHFGYLCEISGG